MSKETLQSLVIEHLRGSIIPFTLAFEKGKKLTVIYGENGTGKSTICDAFDFLGKGNIGSLDNRGLGKTNKYWHSVGKTANDVCVRLLTSQSNCAARLTKAGVIVDPPAKRPKVEVLRRSQILSLVEAKPAERYNAISRFIDVSGVEGSEASLRQLILSIEKQAEVAVARVQENREVIKCAWEQAGNPGTGPKAWAVAETQRDQTTLDARKAAIESLKNAFNKLLYCSEQYRSQSANYQSAEDALKPALESVERLQAQVAGEYLEIFEILQAAQRHFVQHPNPQTCPLCESAENIHGLPEQISRRIESQTIANQLKSAQAALESRRQAVINQNQRVAELKTEAVAAAEKFVQCSQNEHLPPGIGLPSLPCPTDLADWPVWLGNSSQFIEEWGKIADACVESKRFTASLKSSLEALVNNSRIQRELDEVLPRLKSALAIVKDERRKFTDGILHNIASEVGRLYEIVHPGEGLNKITLELDPAKRASLEIATDFQGHTGTPPQAYFSDSHLDTLGLCVFLALSQLEKPEETILVLDDVLASVDEPHVERLIEMLYAEALKFKQCIITTHYKPWKQKLRWGWLKNNQCQFVELGSWNNVSGIVLSHSIPDVERLRNLLAETPPDPQLVCAKAGVILEAALDFLTQLYECRVPRRADGLYTLGDLLQAVDKKLKAALRIEHKHENTDGTFTYIEKPLVQHLDELARVAQARNVFGCHFNVLSFNLLDSDAIAFGKEVLALMDSLIDQETGWPKSSKSGSYWTTAGETRRLHPLKKPA